MMKVTDVNHRVFMDQGLAGFSIAHDIKIEYFLSLRVLKGDLHKITIFSLHHDSGDQEVPTIFSYSMIKHCLCIFA
jgi:hypothetical protein